VSHVLFLDARRLDRVAPNSASGGSLSKEAVMTIRLRPERVLFRFSGPDAEKLLHDVLTPRIAPEAATAGWWALLSPQGKIQAEGLIGWSDNAFYVDTHESVGAQFFKRMKMYRLRANVVMDDLGDTHRVGWAESSEGGVLAHLDGRAPGLGVRVIATTDESKAWSDPDDAAAAARIAAGVAELGTDFAPDTAFPHDVGMDFLGGVDFKKGCYVGQEVVSRMQHRGTARRRPVIVAGLPDGAASAAPLLAAGREAGTIGTPVGGKAVGIVRLDRLEAELPTTVGGLPVSLSLPAWATYRFGEAAADA
jgi:folate-binding protein YgfZ